MPTKPLLNQRRSVKFVLIDRCLTALLLVSKERAQLCLRCSNASRIPLVLHANCRRCGPGSEVRHDENATAATPAAPVLLGKRSQTIRRNVTRSVRCAGAATAEPGIRLMRQKSRLFTEIDSLHLLF